MASTASPEQKKRDKTLVMGFWLDNIMNVRGLAPPSPVGTVANSVAGLVINNINNNFGLVPPLVLDDDMGVAWIPHVTANTDISTLDDKGLITLVQPNEQTSLRVKSRLEEFQRANASKAIVPTIIEQDSVAKLRDELFGQIGSLRKKVDSQGKEIDQLKTSNAELRTSNAELRTSNAELRTSNAELRTSNAELRTSNTELAATLARHAKIIGSLRRRIVLDDARKKLTDNYPNQATLGTEGFINFVIQLHNALSHEDSKLLSLDALQVIFNSSNNSIRSQGNVAAHEAQQGDLAFSVLSVDVKGKQRELLRAIYKYAYSEDPEFLVELDA